MRIIVPIFALILANPLLARNKTLEQPAHMSVPDALKSLPSSSRIEDERGISRTWTLTSKQYADSTLRCEMDVLFGPANSLKQDGATISIWSSDDPVHAGGMKRQNLSRAVIIKEGHTVLVTLTAATSSKPVRTASTR